MPATYYSEALDMIKNWKKNYEDTYEKLLELLSQDNQSIKEFVFSLENCEEEALAHFKAMYPSLTSGSEFNPLTGGDVLVMYKSVAEALKDYGYTGIYIVFDEFSKYIESQSKNAVGHNMKIVQELCELADDSKDPQIFVTLVTHKAIKEYGSFLPEQIINAFTGIEGRIKDIDFVTSSKNNYELIKNAIQVDENKLNSIPGKAEFFSAKVMKEYYKIPVFSANFKQEDFDRIVLKGCYPLNPCAAYLLLNISEKVAQNERTLFTFISKDEANSLAQYVRNHTEEKEWIVNASLIYDYFKGIFKKNVSEDFIHNEWLNAEYALKKAQNEEERNVLKTIAIVNIVNKVDDMPSTVDIIQLSSRVANTKAVLDELERRKVLYKNNSTECYKFKTRAGSELKKEIQKRRELRGDRVNITESMLRISDYRYILPKKYNFEFSMTRYYNYQFMQVSDFLRINNLNVLFDEDKHTDGIVIALFSTDGIDYSQEILDRMADAKTKNVVIAYTKKPFSLSKELLDYEIIQDIKNNAEFMAENEVLKKELLVMEEDLEGDIKKYINDYLGTRKVNLVIYHNGKEWVYGENYFVEKAVDASCSEIYTRTLRINNELINKQYITTAPIKKARKTIIERIVKKNIDDEFINGTGPENTIYRAVLINTGIVDSDNQKSVQQLLDLFTKFIDSSVNNKVSIKKLTDVYYAPPFGMRSGVLPIIFSYVLSYKKGDVVIYKNDSEVEINADTIVAMCDNPEDYSLFISEEDRNKEEYLTKLIETFDPDCYASLSGTRISNVFNCMQRWYRSLPQITKNLRQENALTKGFEWIGSLQRIKSLLQRAEGNAYETLFIGIPNAFEAEGELSKANQELIKTRDFLNGYYDEVLNYLIKATTRIFDRQEKHGLIHTLSDWYEKQSDNAKNGLLDNDVTIFMNTIRELDTFDEYMSIQKVAKSVTGIYVDSWDDNMLESYIASIEDLKTKIEQIKDESGDGKQSITFIDSKGKTQHKYYEKASDSSASILKNIITDALDDFSGISMNDKVAVLVEMLENVINKEV